MKKSLKPVIGVIEEKCTNCHVCISVCPVKYCMDGTGDTIAINHDLCIGCGNCIEACTHKARIWKDDWAEFIAALERREKIVVIAAPAVVASYPDTYLNINGYLASLGVSAVFDVSFGAELTVKSYIHHLQENNPKLVISQPCPAIVTYIEIYKPELLQHLAPADSPMLHTIKMVRRFYPEYKNHRFAVLSPCLAKSREFDEVGLGDFNATLRSLDEHLEKAGIRLSAYPKKNFSNPDPERAVLFSTPGGLLQTAERDAKGIGRSTRKIEGPHTIYHYLDSLPAALKKGTNPLLVDCLNCELGCNGGPGTLNAGKSPDDLEYPIERRRRELEAKYRGGLKIRAKSRLKKTLDRYWEKDLYSRTYTDLSANYTLKKPSNDEIMKIYKSMKKVEEKDFLNCAACGYDSCEAMAMAVFNKLNRPENCHHFLKASMVEEQKSILDFNAGLDRQIRDAQTVLDGLTTTIHDLEKKIFAQFAALEQSSAAVEQMMMSINSTSEVSVKKRGTVDSLVRSAETGQHSMQELLQAISGIMKSVDAVGETIEIIEAVASNTNLLSMNAAIEAAHAGDSGKGFAVVSGEIRRLSETTRENSQNISRTLLRIVEGISAASENSNATEKVITGMQGEIREVANGMTELVETMKEMAQGSSQVTTALADLRVISTDVKSQYGEMTTTVSGLSDSLRRIGESSRERL